MKTGRNGGKKISMKGRNLPPSNHLQFKHRKIPENQGAGGVTRGRIAAKRGGEMPQS